MENNILKFSLLIICFIIFNQNNVAQEGRWTFVSIDSSGLSTYFDKNIRILPNQKIQSWEKLIDDSKQTLYTLQLREYDCENRRLRTLGFSIYKITGELIITSNDPTEWRLVVPESIGETVFNTTCAIAREKQTGTKTNLDGAVAEITDKNVFLRDSASPTSKVIRILNFGEKLPLINIDPIGPWYKVIDSTNKSEGWVSRGNFKIILSEIQKKPIKVIKPIKITKRKKFDRNDAKPNKSLERRRVHVLSSRQVVAN